MKDRLKILVVDDEAAYCEAISMILSDQGHDVASCTHPDRVIDILGAQPADLIISDLIMPKMNGIALLKAVRKTHPHIAFIVLTAYGTVENAVEAMRLGAFAYIIKGSAPEVILGEVENLQRVLRIQESRQSFLTRTESPVYREVRETCLKAALSDTNVLIVGESGVGKEVAARMIFEQGKRSDKPFIAANCQMLSESLLESELFGHEKGAFTGATDRRIGRIESADGGTLFLDEIGDISLSAQTKLLRVIETKVINRIGSNEDIPVDFRLISATNKSLEDEIAAGHFRHDLYYRLNTIIIRVPPLRDRKEDIPALTDFFINQTREALQLPEITVPEAVRTCLQSYSYPGNIRELKNMVERMLVLSDRGGINVKALADYVRQSDAGQMEMAVGAAKAERYQEAAAGGAKTDHRFEISGDDAGAGPHQSATSGFHQGLAADAAAPGTRKEKPLNAFMHESEAAYIQHFLEKYHWNIAQTAEALEISIRTLYKKIGDYHLRDDGRFPGKGGS